MYAHKFLTTNGEWLTNQHTTEWNGVDLGKERKQAKTPGEQNKHIKTLIEVHQKQHNKFNNKNNRTKQTLSSPQEHTHALSSARTNIYRS